MISMRTLKAGVKVHIQVYTNYDPKDDGVDYVELYPCDVHLEPWEEFIAQYRINQDGSFSYTGSCFPGDHDFPAHIQNELTLRALLPEFAALSMQL